MRKLFNTILLFIFFTSTAFADCKNNREIPTIGKTAEEIVVMAHQYDIQSILLTIAGYLTGKYGFQKDISLAQAWLRTLIYIGEIDAYHFAALLFVKKYFKGTNEEQLGYTLANCEMARTYTPSESITIFNTDDVNTICIEADNKKNNIDGWQKNYDNFKRMIQSSRATIQDLTNMLHNLRSHPATEIEQKKIEIAFGHMPLATMIFHITTNYDAKNNLLDYDPKRLISFINTQNKIAHNKNITDMPVYGPGFSMLLSYASKVIIDNLAQPRTNTDMLALLRDAHAGNIEAIRSVAKNYQSGNNGFPADEESLSHFWFLSGALNGDDMCLLTLVISHFKRNQFAPAWAYASIAESMHPDNSQFKILINSIKESINQHPNIDKIIEQGARLRAIFMEEKEKKKMALSPKS